MKYATCHPDRPIEGRGLCATCYIKAWRAGVLGNFAKRTPHHPCQRCGIRQRGDGLRGLCRHCHEAERRAA